jgi:RHS repeat-associated protein
MKAKQSLSLLLLLLLSPGLFSQAIDQNYVQTRTMLDANGDSCLNEIQYVDGLGRPCLLVQKAFTPNRNDLVTLQEYDNLGRESKSWLPAPMSISTAGDMLPQEVRNTVASSYNDTRPFLEAVYEPSPLNRIAEQYGPGEAWASAPVSTNALTNNSTTGSSLCCKRYAVTSSNGITTNGNYPAGELYVTQTTDEDGNDSYTFINKLQQTLLVRYLNEGEMLDTYYIYDDYDNLRFMLQPMYQEEADLDLYAFQYKYDTRNRCIEKKIPGAEAVYYVYDYADHLILMQDGNLRAQGKWQFTIPDVFNRMVLEGVCSGTYNHNTINLASVVCATWAGTTAASVLKGYTVTGITLTSPTVHNAFFYDSYAFKSYGSRPSYIDTDYNYVNARSGYGTQYTGGYQGILTGKLTRYETSGISFQELYTVFYYDKRGNLVQSIERNSRSGEEKNYYGYDFRNKVIKRKHVHSISSSTYQPLTEVYTYHYDHAERPTTTLYQLTVGNTTSPQITLSSKTYNELGQLIENKLHNADALAVEYEYNIRSWLTSISSQPLQMNYYYEQEGVGDSATVAYNGNINTMTWQVSSDNILRGYNFNYDGMNRLTDAKYGEGSALQTNRGRYNEIIRGYDKNSNITSLLRKGKVNNTTYGAIDDLTLTYEGNHLYNIADVATDPLYTNAFNFEDGNKDVTEREYEYDGNGNILRDKDKEIDTIRYNRLNLPLRIEYEDKNYTSYYYTADGTKKSVYANSYIGTEDGVDDHETSYEMSYCGNILYEGYWTTILTDEGYIRLNGTTPTYYYYLKDHQGNNRVIVTPTASSYQITGRVNHYYPFGGLFDITGSAPHSQPFKYNGKELDRIFGLDWYDYSARWMNGALGRFTTIDLLSEEYPWISPYAYCMNNPIRFIDPTGCDTISANKTNVKTFDVENDIVVLDEVDIVAPNPWTTIEHGGVFMRYNVLSGQRGSVVGEKGLINKDGAILNILLLGRLANTAKSIKYLLAGKASHTLSKSAIDSAIKHLILDKNKMHHIFAKAAHNLSPLVLKSGGYNNTIKVILTKLNRTGKLPASGRFKEIVHVNGFNVTVEGSMINGVPRIGTMYIP